MPLSPHNAATSALSTGLLVDTNLETSVPDAYRPPPAPAPFEGLGHQQTPPVAQGICSSKSDAPVQTTPDPVQEAPGDNTQETSVKCEDLKEPEYKKQTIVDLESAKEVEIELSKSVKPVVSVIEEEDVCPTCLEGSVPSATPIFLEHVDSLWYLILLSKYLTILSAFTLSHC